MKYYIGIDGGGTKSRLLAVAPDGSEVGRAMGGSTNLASNTQESVRDCLARLFADFEAGSGANKEDCLAVCIGSAGLDYEAKEQEMQEILRGVGFRCPVVAVNDSLLALAAETRGEPGVVVIAGTGSIAYGRDAEGRTYRAGGWGHLIDDGGSGYWIAKEGVRRTLRAFDGSDPHTLLEQTLPAAFGVALLPEIIDTIYGGANKAELAAFAVYVDEGARQHDAVCCAILEDAAQELFVLVDTILRRMQSPDAMVIASGGTILGCERLFAGFERRVAAAHPGARIGKIQAEPVMGAVYMAMQAAVAV